ncbi:MAG: DNA-primase RepB domain-containing protein [Thiomonas sp.]|uniref:DNA-primase RepB domain-containing protein n=1 Tax=Thiomonas sp. TaxID=2047785 RepID=UPI002A368839|nr:DNA-primase RepB domain-containing protein [Thiomonas sp.]MDY0331128.1 DNA-primase RepB domain-containing protein [Thiomonas sp.]
MHNSQLPEWAQQQPHAKRSALALMFALGDPLPWAAEPRSGLEIAARINPGQRDGAFKRIAALGEMSGTGDWLDALTSAGGMNRRPAPLGANIYIRPLPAAAHPWILLDDLPSSRAVALTHRHSGIAVQTSEPNPAKGEKEGNAQAWILLDRPLYHPDRTAIARALASHLDGDPAAANGSQPGRLTGFQQRKSGKSGWTNILSDTSRTLRPWSADALLKLAGAGAGLESRGGSSPPACPTGALQSLSPSPLPPKGQGAEGHRPTHTLSAPGGDESAREFAFACHRLRGGWPRERIEAAIAARARQRDKRKNEVAAHKYAAATVRKAELAVRGERP